MKQGYRLYLTLIYLIYFTLLWYRLYLLLRLTRMTIYANYSAIFRQRECEHQFSQIIRKSGRILMKKSRNLWKFVKSSLQIENRPFSKMAAENSNRSILKTYAITRKNTFTLVTLQSFSLRRLYDWGYTLYPQSYKRLWIFQFSTYIFSADITPEMLKPGRVTKVNVFLLVLVYVMPKTFPNSLSKS